MYFWHLFIGCTETLWAANCYLTDFEILFGIQAVQTQLKGFAAVTVHTYSIVSNVCTVRTINFGKIGNGQILKKMKFLLFDFCGHRAAHISKSNEYWFVFQLQCPITVYIGTGTKWKKLFPTVVTNPLDPHWIIPHCFISPESPNRLQALITT